MALADLTWHALPNNDLEISDAACIFEKVSPVQKKVSPVQNGLPEYDRFMAITESKEIMKNEEHLKRASGHKPRSDYYVVVLVRRESTRTLAGCFLFDLVPISHSQNALASSNAGAWKARLLFQRVYPSIGVKASDWYRCRYAALFREILYKGFSLSVHLPSSALPSEIRMAPDTVYSISPALPIVEDKLAHAVTEAAAKTELLKLGAETASRYARGSDFGWGVHQSLLYRSKLLYIVSTNTNIVGYYLAVRSITSRPWRLYKAVQPVPSASRDYFERLIEQELYAIGYLTASDFEKETPPRGPPDARQPWAAALSDSRPIASHSNVSGVISMRWLTREEWSPLFVHQESQKMEGFNDGHDHPPQFPPDEHRIYIACRWRPHQPAMPLSHSNQAGKQRQQAETPSDEIFLFRKDPRLAVDTLGLVHGPKDDDKYQQGLQACISHFRSLGWAGSMHEDTVLPHLSSHYCHFLSSFTSFRFQALHWADDAEVIQPAENWQTHLPHAARHLYPPSSPLTDQRFHIACSILSRNQKFFLVFAQSALPNGQVHLMLTEQPDGCTWSYGQLAFDGFNQSLWEFGKRDPSVWIGIEKFLMVGIDEHLNRIDFATSCNKLLQGHSMQAFEFEYAGWKTVLQLKERQGSSDIELELKPDTSTVYGPPNNYYSHLPDLIVQQGLREIRHHLQASGWVGKIWVKWPGLDGPDGITVHPMLRGLHHGLWEQENGAAPEAGKECHFVSL